MNNKIGVVASLHSDKPCFNLLKKLRLSTCQLISWMPELWTEAHAGRIRMETRKERVRFPEFVKRQDEIGFTGEFIIEREITGPQQQKDIAETVAYLRKLLNQ